MTDLPYSEEFFSSFLESLQNLSQMYLSYNRVVDISGYINVEIDNVRKERYVLSEILQFSGNSLSESYCLKAFKSDISEHGSDDVGKQKTRNKDTTYSSSMDTPYHSNFTGDWEDYPSPPSATNPTSVDCKKRKLNTCCSPTHVENEEHVVEVSSFGQNNRRLQIQERMNISSSNRETRSNDSEPSVKCCRSESRPRPIKQEHILKADVVDPVSTGKHTSFTQSKNTFTVPFRTSGDHEVVSGSTCVDYRTQLEEDGGEDINHMERSDAMFSGNGGSSKRKNRDETLDDPLIQTDIAVMKELGEDVTYSVYKNSDAFSCEPNDIEYSISEADCEPSPVESGECFGTEASPGEDVVIIDDDDEDGTDITGHEVGQLDTSLLDTAAQYKLATFKQPLQSAVKTFLRFLHIKQIQEPVLHMSPSTLDKILAEFYVSARTKSGQNFSSGSLRTIKNYLEFFLHHNGYPVSISRGKDFEESCKVLKQKLEHLSCHEKSSVAVQREDVDMMFNSGILGSRTPVALVRTLWLMITVHFQIKGAKKHLMMTWGDFELQFCDNGEEILYYKPLGIMARGNKFNPSRCFIKHYKMYKRLRPESTLADDHPFYLDVSGNQFLMSRISDSAMKCMWKRMLLDADLPKEKKVLDLNIL